MIYKQKMYYLNMDGGIRGGALGGSFEPVFARLFTPILAILISQNSPNIYFAKNSFQIFPTVTCHSVTVKSHFNFFLFHKILFEFKSNHFK